MCNSLLCADALCNLRAQRPQGDRFDLVIGDRKNGRVFALVATNKEDCAKWMDAIAKCLADRDAMLKDKQMSSGASSSSAPAPVNVASVRCKTRNPRIFER